MDYEQQLREAQAREQEANQFLRGRDLQEAQQAQQASEQRFANRLEKLDASQAQAQEAGDTRRLKMIAEAREAVYHEQTADTYDRVVSADRNANRGEQSINGQDAAEAAQEAREHEQGAKDRLSSIRNGDKVHDRKPEQGEEEVYEYRPGYGRLAMSPATSTSGRSEESDQRFASAMGEQARGQQPEQSSQKAEPERGPKTDQFGFALNAGGHDEAKNAAFAKAMQRDDQSQARQQRQEQGRGR